ncbi:universal stress protein [Streptomyces sp. NBC_00390]|uniref:universal stress protein n=1 Tax=Streptomyces sp. NBC_00390 TaxID=2975736 RepID=UPI002E1FD980
MELPLVVGVDGSDSSLQAVDRAVDEAARHRLPLRLLHGSLWERYDAGHPSFGTERPAGDPHLVDDAARVHGERASNLLADALREAVRDRPRVDVHRRPVEGPAHTVLLDASSDADLLVVGALRRHGHFGLQFGRVAHVLLHHSECPVAVIPQRA